MKKGKIQNPLLLMNIFILMMAFVVQPALSIEITTSKEVYYPRETLQAEISGNFISLKSENILVYKEGVPRSIPVISELVKHEGVYYFYAILPGQEGNFSLRIENSEYTKEGELKNDVLTKDFEIKKGNQSYLSIIPGFVVADKEFVIKIKSLKGNFVSNADLGGVVEVRNISLIEDVEKRINFPISNIPSGKTYLKIEDYNIPVFIISKTNKSFIEKEKELEFFPNELSGKIVSGDEYFYQIRIINIVDRNLTNIRLSNNLNAEIKPDFIEVLNKKSYTNIDVTIKISEDLKYNLSGEIKAEFDNNEVILPILFSITKKRGEVNISGTSTGSIDCDDIGKKCLSNEYCNGKIRDSKQGECCLGECVKIKESNKWFFIGISLLIILALAVGISYLLIKKRQIPKSTDEILKEKSRRFQDRMEGNEVKKNLGRI